MEACLVKISELLNMRLEIVHIEDNYYWYTHGTYVNRREILINVIAYKPSSHHLE